MQWDEEVFFGEEEREELLEEYIPPEEKPWWMHWALPFLASVVVHIFLIIGALLIVFTVWNHGKMKVINVAKPNEITPLEYDKNRPRDVTKTPLVDADTKEVEHPIIELEQEEPETKDIPKGTSFDCLSNKNMDSTGYIDAYGIGGGRAGAFGVPWGRGRFAHEGDGIGTESAVIAALRWLWRHQNRPDPDKGMSKGDPECGGWDVVRFERWCKKPGACPNNNPNKSGAVPGFNVAVTGFATLAFLGHGNTHLAGDFRRTVKMALEYLIRHQDGEGWIGREGGVDEWIYNHAIATMALCEAYAMTQDPWLEEPCRKAVQCIINAQNPGLGWRYKPAGGDNDTSVTGWMVLALKGAKNAGIPVPETTWQGALNWFDRCFNPADGHTGYQSKFDRGSVIPGVNDMYERLPTMTSVAVICRIFCGQPRKDRRVKKGVELVMKHLPQWNPARDPKGLKIDMYYWYYATYAMFQFGGPLWDRWNKAMKEALLKSQRRGGCADGSWDPVGKWGMVGGRVYSTALNALTLEIYYRYKVYRCPRPRRSRHRRYLSGE